MIVIAKKSKQNEILDCNKNVGSLINIKSTKLVDPTIDYITQFEGILKLI